jgi:predicted nucleic acid-binding protein
LVGRGNQNNCLPRSIEGIHNYSDRIFPVTQEIAETWGLMNVPNPVSTVDGLLAAIAKIHNCTLVTRNVKDIRECGVSFYNPFE